MKFVASGGFDNGAVVDDGARETIDGVADSQTEGVPVPFVGLDPGHLFARVVSLEPALGKQRLRLRNRLRNSTENPTPSAPVPDRADALQKRRPARVPEHQESNPDVDQVGGKKKLRRTFSFRGTGKEISRFCSYFVDEQVQ